jgi:hypothetical protein
MNVRANFRALAAKNKARPRLWTCMLGGNVLQCVCLQNFKPQNLDALTYALYWDEGAYFGDALHLAMNTKEPDLKPSTTHL